ncbi:MAG: signal peptidase II [Clostridia bacterium]|nr:signal peptidase II [Clostridia bacterium]MBO5127597.1 signal peptidase II [Clostridia bacterium]MBO5256006.1 signal peptidase II [Clostridia bacterium]MBP3294168.1 signal peptidase II [Clostridia bacterium]
MILTVAIMILCVVLDQWTKVLAVEKLAGIATYPLIENIFHFTYVENRGAAFGMLADHRWVFMIFSTAAILAMLGWLFWEKPKSWWIRVSAAFIIAGGIGNMIDRVRLGYVVDFIDCRFIDFYVFNVADSFVCVGCAMFLLAAIYMEIMEAKKKKTAQASDTAEDGDGDES